MGKLIFTVLWAAMHIVANSEDIDICNDKVSVQDSSNNFW